jgi:hypothetical protein
MAVNQGKADLKDLQKRLNEDPKLAQKFLKDPVATLKAEGITLAPDMAQDLKSFMDTSGSSKTKADAVTSGAVEARPRIKISIGIKVGV